MHGPFTRETLRERLQVELTQASGDGRRVLFGLDHQWSWPRDLWRAAGLAELSWREALERLVLGSEATGRPPLGPPSAFARAFNAWAGAAIFHCRVKGLARAYGLPTRSDWRGDPVRLTERLMPGAKSATRLGGTGAVAGQTLHGLRELWALLKEADSLGLSVLVWPQDSLVDDGRSHVGVEVYPTFCRPPHVPQSDDADARACCAWAAGADLERELDLTRVPPAVQAVARLEGWILGARYRE